MIRAFSRLKRLSAIGGRRYCAWLLLTSLASLASSPALAQRRVAITNARIETAAKSGVIEKGTILIHDGKIEAIGADVTIPAATRRINLQGKTVTPGIVDPYYVVTIGRNTSSAPPRTVTFRGRTFIIGGGTPSIATTFARVADGFAPDKENWLPAIRSGITTYHLVTGGLARSAFGAVDENSDAESEIVVSEPDGRLIIAITNDTKTLDVLRGGLKEKSSPSPSSGRPQPSPAQLAALRARFGNRIPSSRPSPSSTSSKSGSKKPTESEQLWSDVREGKNPLFVNVNNASTILHLDSLVSDAEKAKVALVAAGPDVFLNLENLSSEQYSIILPPRIDLKPNSRTRINVPALMNEAKIDFVFSLSLGQSEFRSMQHNPLFSVGMLIRAGLDRNVAMQALTLGPAKLLGLDKEIGSLEVKKSANLVVFDGDPFEATSEIEQVFIQGKRVYEQ